MTAPTVSPAPPIFFSTQPVLKCEVCRRYFGGIMEAMWAADTFNPQTTNPDGSNPKVIYEWFQQVAAGNMTRAARRKWQLTREGTKKYALDQFTSGRIKYDAYLNILEWVNRAEREAYQPRLYLLLTALFTTETYEQVEAVKPSIEYKVYNVAVDGKFPVIEEI